MQITLPRADLLAALARVKNVVERRNTIPILGNVLLRADEAGLTCRATDLDIEIVETLKAEVARPGATTAPAHTLFEIARKLPEGAQVQIELAGDRGTLTVRAGRSRFALQTLPEGDFPDLAAGEMSHRFTLPGGELVQLIERTQFAISTEETRYYLNGIYLHAVEEEGATALRAVATDGHRLAQAQVARPEGAAGMPGIILPRKLVGEIGRVAGDAAEVAVELSAAKIRLAFGGVTLTSKLIDGTYPDYGRVVPRDNDRLLTLDRAGFAAAVDRVATLASDRGRAVKLAADAGRVTLTVTNPDAGSAAEEIEAEYAAEPIEIGFNSRYLLDILAALPGEAKAEGDGEVEIALKDPGSPALLRIPSAPEALCVLMPMRV